MLSKTDFIDCETKLNTLKDICVLIRVGTNNLKSKIKTQDYNFFETFKVKSLLGVETDKLFLELQTKTNIATFLLYISEFEKIFYGIAIKKIGAIQSEIAISNGNFLTQFIKSKKDFYPFSEIKKFYTSEDNNYLSEIIALRNYFAHGEKEIDDQEYKKNKYVDTNLINNLDDLNDRLIDLLKRLKYD